MTDPQDNRADGKSETASGRSEPEFDGERNRAEGDLAVVRAMVADHFDHIETIQREPSDSAWECLFRGRETVYSVERTDTDGDETPRFGVYSGQYSADHGYERVEFLEWFDEASDVVEFLNGYR